MGQTVDSATREALQESFYQLLETVPYNKIKIQDIAAGAFTVRANFYNYYKSKDELIDAITQELRDSLQSRLKNRVVAMQAVPDFTDKSLRSIIYPNIVGNLENLNKHRLFFLIKNRATLDVFADLREIYLQNLLQSIPEHIHRHNSETTINYTCRYTTFGVFAVVQQWMSDAEPLPITEISILLYKQIIQSLQLLDNPTK